MKKIITLSLFLITAISSKAQLEYKDVASIFYSRCSSCHRSGGGGPFPLVSYSDVAPHTAAVQHDLNTNHMPPWPPDTTYTRFLHEKLITSSEKNAILSWISTGALQGNLSQVPAPPTYPAYKLSGTPTLTAQIPTYTSTASTSDIYICFSIPLNLAQDQYLRAFEVVPGTDSIVHHAVINVDTTGTVASDYSGNCYTEPGQFSIGGYAPGAEPTVFPGQAPLKTGIRIKAGSNLIIQIHYPKGTIGSIDSTKVRMYFYPVGTTGIRPIYVTTNLQNWSMSIPANTVKNYTAHYPASGGLTYPISIFATFPHSHKVAVSMTDYAYSTSPIDTIPLVRVNNWDFEHQGYYTFRNLVKVPLGYKLFTKHVYDNTTNNPHNPSSPPQLVIAGTSTTDEMLFDSFQWLVYQTGDETIDIGSLLSSDSLLTNPTSIKEVNATQGFKTFVFPNPAKDKIFIGYFLETASDVNVEVYDMFGKKVKTMTKKMDHSGAGDVEWDCKSQNGNELPEGVYFYTISAGKSIAKGKFILAH